MYQHFCPEVMDHLVSYLCAQMPSSPYEESLSGVMMTVPGCVSASTSEGSEEEAARRSGRLACLLEETAALIWLIFWLPWLQHRHGILYDRK